MEASTIALGSVAFSSMEINKFFTKGPLLGITASTPQTICFSVNHAWSGGGNSLGFYSGEAGF